MVMDIFRSRGSIEFEEPHDHGSFSRQVTGSLTLLPILSAQRSIWFGRSFRKKSPNDMAFPHPQSRKDHCREEDIPGWRGVIWKVFKRTIDITDYRDTQDEVNP